MKLLSGITKPAAPPDKQNVAEQYPPLGGQGDAVQPPTFTGQGAPNAPLPTAEQAAPSRHNVMADVIERHERIVMRLKK